MRGHGMKGACAALGLVLVSAAGSVAAQDTSQGAGGEPAGEMTLADRARELGASLEMPLEPVEIPVARTLTLDDAIALGRRNNPDMELARVRLESARVYQTKAWAALVPSVSAQAIYTFNDEELTIAFGPGQEAVIRPRDELRATATVSSTFDARLFPALDSALLAEDVANLTRRDVERQIDYAVIQLYHQMLTLERVMDINRSALEAQVTLLTAVRARLEAGTATEFEFTRGMTEVVKAQGELERTRLGVLNARRALAALLVTEPDFGVVAPPPVQAPAPRDDGQQEALRLRPDLARADLSIRLAENDLEILYWSYLPTLTGQFNMVQTEETAFNPDTFSWNIQLILSWRIFDGGLREANIKETGYALEEARIQRQRLERDIASELDQAYEQLRSKEILLETSAREVSLAQIALEQALEGYKLGAVNQLEVLNAELALRIARIQRATYELDHRLAIHNIQRVIGQEISR